MTITQLIAIGVALSTVYYVWTTLRNPLSNLPGPWYAKWTSVVVTYYWLQGRRSHYVQSLHEKYGPVVRISPDEVYFTDLDAVRTIYGHREDFRKSSWYTRMTSSPLKSVFSTPDIEMHRRHRRLLAGPMAETALAQHIPIISRRVDLAVSRMREESQASESGGAADVWKWSLFMATDIIGELTFGESFKTLELGRGSAYTDDLKSLAPLSGVRATFPSLIKLTNILPIPAFVRARAASARMQQYAVDSLSRYSNILREKPANVRGTLFTRLFDAASDSEKLSFDELCVNAMAYIVAGSDTTANTFAYLVWSVCRRPDIKARLLDELSSLPENWTESDLRGLKYLNWVIEESLRCFSAAPTGLPRVVPGDGAELGGYWIPGGTTVCAQAFSLHQKDDVYPHPTEFDPTRWESPSHDMKDAFFAFGRGSRVCLGKNLAYIELRLAAARFFLEFPNAKVSTHKGMSDNDMAPKIWFLLMPSGQRCLIDLK